MVKLMIKQVHYQNKLIWALNIFNYKIRLQIYSILPVTEIVRGILEVTAALITERKIEVKRIFKAKISFYFYKMFLILKKRLLMLNLVEIFLVD
jgi:hypothetical protein